MVDMANGALSATTPGSFAVGDILGRSLSLFRNDFGRFVLLCGIFLAPELLISLALTRASGLRLTVAQLVAVNYGRLLIATILHSLAAVTIISGTFARLNGRPLRIAHVLRDGRGRYAPAVGVVILQNIIFMIGIVLLVLPGFIMATMWYVALSVCVIEKRGVIASFRRSAALTKGHRWSFFGIFLVATIGGATVLYGIQHLLMRYGDLTVRFFVYYVVQLLTLSFGTIVGTTAYQTVRTAKEGLAVETFAAVFA